MDFQARQVVIIHREVWLELRAWASRRGMGLYEIRPCRGGDLPTYAFSFNG